MPGAEPRAAAAPHSLRLWSLEGFTPMKHRFQRRIVRVSAEILMVVTGVLIALLVNEWYGRPTCPPISVPAEGS